MSATRPTAAVLAAAFLATGCSAAAAPGRPSPTAATGLGDRAAAGASGPGSVRVVTRLTFRSPSGRIVCGIDREAVRCDVAHTWRLPPAPAGCDAEYGSGAALQAGGAAELSCAGDPVAGTVAGSGAAPLPYAATVRSGPLSCTSERTGMTCRDVRTSHGFTVSRAAYRLF